MEKKKILVDGPTSANRICWGGLSRHGAGEPRPADYEDDRDRKIWLETLVEACQKAGWRIHAYVLMGNHYHLLLETPEPNLAWGMKWLQGTYTQRYNSRHEVFGHLFQGRYKALVIDESEGNYFPVVSTYIHLNPARARLVPIEGGRLERYGWSSYRWYLKAPKERPDWLVTGRVMGDLGLKPSDGDGYEAYVAGRMLELGMKAGRKALAEEWRAIRRGWYLGGDGFRGRLLRKVKAALKGRQSASHAGEAKRTHGEAEAERLLGLGLVALGMKGARLEETPKGMREKQLLAWWIRKRTTVGRRWVSERLCMGEESAVTRGCRAVMRKQDTILQRLKGRLEHELSSEDRS